MPIIKYVLPTNGNYPFLGKTEEENMVYMDEGEYTMLLEHEKKELIKLCIAEIILEEVIF